MSQRTGLDGVIVADSLLSQVDGDAGRLVVCGFDIERLAAEHGFETVCGLLWNGALPDVHEQARLRCALGAARRHAHEDLWRLGAALERDSAMESLRAALAHLSADPEAGLDVRARIVGAAAVYTAAWHRVHAGLLPVPPEPERGHADDTLRMTTGRSTDPALVRALDAYLVTVAEHGMNASTFTARIVASTDSDPVSAVVAAVGALKGPLHGGAPGPVLDMLDAIGEPELAEDWLRAELEAGRRIMGLGHRVYRVRDPRAAVFEAALARLERDGHASRYLRLARAVEEAAVKVLAERFPDRRLETNVEFYTAVLLDAIGLPRALFSPMFAVGRVAGWLAHFGEQRRTGRIIRPRQRYTGPMPSTPAPAAAGA